MKRVLEKANLKLKERGYYWEQSVNFFGIDVGIIAVLKTTKTTDPRYCPVGVAVPVVELNEAPPAQLVMVRGEQDGDLGEED